MARKWKVPLAMHLAESPDEEALTMEGKGPFAETLKQLGFWREGMFPNGYSIQDWLRLLGEGASTLVVHGNYLSEIEMQILAKCPLLSVVYCPRTHAYFQHPPHPVGQLLRCGIRVALGTDSRASNPDLDLGNEVRYLLSHRQDLFPESVLRMATLSGAEALGEPSFGYIEAGATGKILVLPLTSNRTGSLWDWVAESILQQDVRLLPDG
jgi:cytosine/adenosine deaminase-related metal-dependent hydrolase